ncbi:MAG: SMC-Scp complex subunit ScpB [Actinobacteria bacterium]|nr:MAG: SMC-Scp complex subunit ScpB [Actinomycetota bacterium]
MEACGNAGTARSERLVALESLSGIVEALLFVSDDPLSIERISEVIGEAPKQVKRILAKLAAEYEAGERGFQLKEVAGGYRLYSHPAYAPYIEKMIRMWDTRRLSQASLETLAILAYKQPITRLTVNAIRGVNSEGVISSLVEKRLIRPVGRERSPGSPILYGTTKTFLERFGLRSLRDLPPLEEFAPDDETRRRIEEGLGGLRAKAGDPGGGDVSETVRGDGSEEVFDAKEFLDDGTARGGA